MDQIIDKIKKLIALSEDQSTSEHERLLALKRAQALMIKYSIDSIQGEVEDSIIKIEFNLGRTIFGLDTTSLCRILSTIGPYFGCYSFYKKTSGQVYLMGFKVNCEIVDYTAHVLINQGLRDCLRLWRDAPSANTKLAFWKGFCEGLQVRFKLNSEESEGLVLYDKVREKFLANTKLVSSFQGGSSLDAQQAGSQSALEAKVNHALKTSPSEQIKLG
jgi:hypothetical protein